VSGNDLFDDLHQVMVVPDYQKAMLLIEQLVHKYRHGRNSPSVIKWASVTYYNTNHLFYAWNWALTYLWAESRKVRESDGWYDEHYLWQFTETTVFIEKLASHCGSPIILEVQNQVDALQQVIRNGLKTEDFMWSTVSDTNEQIFQFHQQMVTPLSDKLQGLNPYRIFDMIEVITALNDLKENEEFSKHILVKSVNQAQQIVQSMQSYAVGDLRNGYNAIISLANSDGFATPMPDRITYKEYWNKIQVVVLSEYIRSLKTM
jgi:hypothetical protein